MRAWLVRTVAMADLEATLCALERAHPPAAPPIITYVDQTRVIISWSYWENSSNAPSL